MHILITDSGVGGLSVCAYAERFLRSHGFTEPVKLTYINASRENDFGYNSMRSRSEKLEYFDRFLHIISDEYSPDCIYIACNTLSVLLPETKFSREARIPVKGIVETGVKCLVRHLIRSPQSNVVIFGTATTIEAKTYPTLLVNAGVPGARVVSQACPDLADTISEDRQGFAAKELIDRYVRTAAAELETLSAPCLVYLACTHYGYRQELFSAAFQDAGVQYTILNPNEFAVDDLFESARDALHDPPIARHRMAIDVEFVSRYRIPETALETITHFLSDVSPATVHAFQNFTHAPDLF
jgi:glutamate racemase